MSRFVTFAIALAHLTHRRRQTIVSTLGVALGVGFFIATSALMRGSEQDFLDRLVNSQPHITIKDEFREPTVQPAYLAFPDGAVDIENVKPRERLRGIKNFGGKIADLRREEGVTAAPALTGQAILRYGGEDTSAALAGIDPDVEPELTRVAGDMLEGGFNRLKTTNRGIVIGFGIARRLNVKMDDLINVIAPSGTVARMKVVGIFRTGNLQFDDSQTYTRLKDAQVIFNKPFVADQIRIKIADPEVAEAFAKELETRWAYRAESWQEVSRDLLGLFVIRNAIVYSIVGAIMIVASFGIFNIVSTMVLEKRRDIAILMSLGFRAADIQMIFLVQGIVLGFAGMFAGWAVGWVLLQILASIEFDVEGFVAMQGFVLDFSFEQYLIGGAFAVISAVVAAWFPARKASQVHPVDIIRGAA